MKVFYCIVNNIKTLSSWTVVRYPNSARSSLKQDTVGVRPIQWHTNWIITHKTGTINNIVNIQNFVMEKKRSFYFALFRLLQITVNYNFIAILLLTVTITVT